MRSSRLAKRALCALFLALAFPPERVTPQVRIHEVVDIVDSSASSPTFGSAWIVCPDSGTATIHIRDVTHVETPIDSSSRLELSVGQRGYSLSVFRFTGSQEDWLVPARDICNGLITVQVPLFNRTWAEGRDSILVVPVRRGDTLFIRYVSGRTTNQALESLVDNQWRVSLTRSHECYLQTGCSPCPLHSELACNVTIRFNKPIDILLGQTLYVQGTPDPDRTRGLLFRLSSRPMPRGTSEQVAFSARLVTGGKPGLYLDALDSNGVAIPADQCRMIGRFWSVDTSYSVMLFGDSYGRSDSILVRIIPPSRLGSTYRETRTVDLGEQTLNFDSICVVFGGKWGIPPHYIKGQAFEEAAKVRGVFYPTYRYEPFTTQFDGSPQDSTSSFFVRGTGMGNDPIPPHSNVRPTAYPNQPRNVWYYIENYSALAHGVPPIMNLYGRRNPTRGFIDFGKVGYIGIQLTCDSILTYFLRDTARAESASVALALDSTATYLKNTWRGGLSNVTAQTRLYASYGHLQLLYGTATERGYPRRPSATPEALNGLDSLLGLACRYQARLLVSAIRGNRGDSWRDWPGGFEAAFRRVFAAWNPRASYPSDVLRAAKQFLPVR
jgi:hypothetical protein